MIDSRRRRLVGASAAVGAAALAGRSAIAQKRYGPGVSDTSIRIGQTIAYSGPASAYGQLGRVEAAFFQQINERGGINGRKIEFISVDDGYSPPKAVEMVRKLVEQDEVLLIFGNLGTPINISIRQYLNAKKVPQIFIAAGSSRFADPAHFPWTIGWQPTLSGEAAFYAQSIMQANPGAKIGVLFQDDDFGKEMLNSLKDALGDKAGAMLVRAESFQATDPTIDSQIVSLRSAGADTVMLFAYAKQTSQAIRKIGELGWKPEIFIHLGSASVGATLAPAGLDKSIGVKTAGFIKDPSDSQWADDPAIRTFKAFMTKYLPDGKIEDGLNIMGYAAARTLEQVLRQCGDDLTRESVMRQVANLKNLRLDELLPGSIIDTSPTDFRVVEYMKLQRFNGKVWEFPSS
ncbi:MAG: ABC transporter substrate-binding protein [Burkholderiaceae bacterium]